MAKERSSLSYDKLGGMRTDKPITNLEPHEAIQARNTRMSTTGRIVRRKGGSKYNTTQYSDSSNILGVYQFLYGSSSSKFLVTNNTSLYTDNGTTQSAIKTGLTAAKYPSFETFQGYCLYTNGADTPIKYDGTTVSNLSIAIPSAAPVLDSQTTGGSLTLTSTYKYVVTFYNSTTFQESNPNTLANALSVTLTGSNNKILLKTIPVSSDPQVNARRIYRTTAGGSIYNAQLVTTIADNSTTTYTDSTADTALGALINLSYDPAPIFKKIVIHTNRGFGFKENDSVLYFSVINNPWYWPQAITDLSFTALNYTIPIGQGDGDVITNIVNFYDYLLIFKNRSVYILRGYDETNFVVQKLEFMQGVGCVSFRSAITVLNYCYFISNNGIYRTNAQTIEYIGAPMQGFFDPDSLTTTQKVNASKLSESLCVLDNRKPLNGIRFQLATANSTVNDLCLFYDYASEQWFYDSGYAAQSYCVRVTSGVDYVMRGDDYGYVWTENTQEGDGALITSYATGGTSTSLLDSSLNMTPDLYKGCYLEILNGTSFGDRFRILSNTVSGFSVSGFGTFTSTPDTTSYYTVGGIDFFYQHRWDNYGNPNLTKRWQFVRPRFDVDGQYTIYLYYLLDFEQVSTENTSQVQLSAATLWDVALWDVGVWDSPTISQSLQRPPANRIHNWGSFGVSHKPAGQVVKLNGYDKIFQVKGFGIR